MTGESSLPSAVDEAIEQDARRVLRFIGPALSVSFLLEGLTHLIGSSRFDAFVLYPAFAVAVGLVMTVLAWRSKDRIESEAWILLPWAVIILSTVQHTWAGAAAKSALILAALLVATGGIFVSGPVFWGALAAGGLALGWTAAIAFAELGWFIPFLLSPGSLLMRYSRRQSLKDAERRRFLQSALIERDLRLEGLEQMRSFSAGLSHHFNNLLTTILAEASHAREELPAHHPLRESMQSVHEAALRAAQLVSALSDYTGGRHRQPPRQVAAEALVREVCEQAPPRPAEIAVGQPDLRIETEVVPLRLALRHLVDNAVEASPEGRLEIRIGREHLPGEGPSVKFEILDEGPGVPESELERIFEPFRTSKGPSRAGLGLAVASGIVSRLGGQLRLVRRSPSGMKAVLRVPERRGPRR